MPQCRQCAVAEHPIVRERRSAHCTTGLRTLVRAANVCAINLAERQRCNVILDDAGESILCNGLGCRVGF